MDPLIQRAQERLEWLQMMVATRPVLVASVAVGVLAYVLAWCRVFSKAGYSSVIGLFAILPPMAFVFPFVLGFLRSPADRELATVRRIDELMERSHHDRQNLRRAA